jgi:Protein kinase domain
MARVSVWARICLILASIEIVLGSLGFFFGSPAQGLAPPSSFPNLLLFTHVILFASAAGVLILGGAKDIRAAHLGGLFLLVACAYAVRFVLNLSALGGVWKIGILPWTFVFPDAFLPCFLWLFIRDFPYGLGSGRPARIFRAIFAISLVSGFGLFVANLARGLNAFYGSERLELILRMFARTSAGSYYWLIIFILLLLALPFAMWKARSAQLQERRRVQLFVASLAIGLGPLIGQLVLEILIPPFRTLMNLPENRRLFGFVVYPFLLSIPFTATYAVLVHRVLNIELIIRRAIQYLLARYTVLFASIVPFAGLAIYIYQRRQQTITELFSGTRIFGFAAAAVASIVLLALRKKILTAIDRFFFREHYDARQILAQLVEKSRSAEGIRELATLLNREIDKALHLESRLILVADLKGWLISPDPQQTMRPLACSSALAAFIESSPEPLEVDLENPKTPLRRLPLEDRQWLADSKCQLLVPLIGSDGTLVGCIVLGPKRSEIPFSVEDRLLLSAIASSAALTIENRVIRSSPTHGKYGYRDVVRATAPGSGDDEELAEFCVSCNKLNPPEDVSCRGCGGELKPADVPYILNGKFRFEYKIGSGGMGVVYRATDLDLGRAVAIKTLPKVSPEHAVRLRREARAAAAVAHPNLAVIFAAETWRGTPMLVFEYLAGGTLADRLKRFCLSPEETIHLGITIADVLSSAHALGILHRDIKPSNIGYTKDSVVKLLDFGLARIVDDSRRESAEKMPSHAQATTLVAATFEFETTSGILGTPCYVSPEALTRKSPDVSFDLWGLAIVLYECLAGLNPMAAATLQKTLDRIQNLTLPDIRQLSPDCPEALALFLRNALSRDVKRRPQTAPQFKKELELIARPWQHSHAQTQT